MTADFAMCVSDTCSRSHECLRHAHSGTMASGRNQTFFDASRREGWTAEHCGTFIQAAGHGQKAFSRSGQQGGAGLYGGKGF